LDAASKVIYYALNAIRGITLNALVAALSLALSALSSALPVTALGTGAAIAACFEPEEDCTALAVDAIDRAETQFLVNAYALTTSSRTVLGLIRAKRRGVDVRVIADRTTPCEHKSGLGPLAEAGVPIWIDSSVRIAHSKAMVIDGKVTLTGSMSWTGGAAYNSENLALLASPAIAAAYAGHWHQRLALSSSYTRREDWCHSREPVGLKSETWTR
jgi:phosphatidylserine/phosphatidylglycerophosphate/cardiolipin synthase-like enzyme